MGIFKADRTVWPSKSMKRGTVIENLSPETGKTKDFKRYCDPGVSGKALIVDSSRQNLVLPDLPKVKTRHRSEYL
jgi:hypothetical protein